MKKIRGAGLLFLVLLFLIPVALFGQRFNFEQFTIEDGLAQGYVYTLIQDNQGYLWIGTGEGLSRYDGRGFRTFTTADSLSENFVTTSFVASDGRIWFGHYQGGVSVYEKGRFRKIKLDEDKISRVVKITEAGDGSIWIASQRTGLMQIDQGVVYSYSDEFSGSVISNLLIVDGTTCIVATSRGAVKARFTPDHQLKIEETVGSDLDGSIQSIRQAKDGTSYFIGTDEGLYLYKPLEGSADKKFKAIIPNALVNYPDVQVIFENDKNVWLGTKDEGLIRMQNFDSQLAVQRSSVMNNTNGLPNDYITSIIQDREGNMWFGTYGDGLLKLVDARFTIFDKRDGLKNEDIESVYRLDDSSGIWLGTHSGLSYMQYDEATDKQSFTNVEISNNVIVKCINSMDGSNLLLGTSEGLYVYKSASQKVESSFLNREIKARIITGIEVDKYKNVWIATIGNGLFKYGASGSLKHFNTNNGLTHNDIYHTYLDPKGTMWLATQGGGVISISGDKIETNYGSNDFRNKDFSCITGDRKGNIWFGTLGDGVWKFDGSDWTNYKTDNGLASNYCYQIHADVIGRIWVGHRTGVTRIDPNDETFGVFAAREGFASVETNQNAVFEDTDGKIWFGTSKGVVQYDPLKERTNLVEPLTYLTNIRIFDHDTMFVSGAELPYDLYKINFEFLGISLTDPQKVRYEWMLEGYDLEWNGPSKDNVARYPRLDQGSYAFKVRSFNNDGLGNREVTEFKFSIATPFWQTWWFIALSVLSVTGLVLSYIRWRLKALSSAKITLENMVKERTYELEKAREIAEDSKKAKERFLANMSHEIRTPMNAVLGMTDILSKTSLDTDQEELVDAINFSANNLLVIINDILDLSKIEAGKINFEKTHINLEDILRNLVQTYSFTSDEKGLKLYHTIDEDVPLHVLGDPTRLTQILTNLTGNAIKFTDQGEVELSVGLISETETNAIVGFAVRDTGIGIPKSKLETIFETFTQASEDTTRLYGGTGLGLAISKQLVELQGGQIRIRSKQGVGTTFSFEVKFEKATEENQVTNNEIDIKQHIEVIRDMKLLVAEDNNMNILFLQKLLERWNVNFSIAENGEVALEKLRNDGPFELVLMDVQMPVMDGLTASRNIRKSPDPLIRDIPILATTALTGTDEVMKCIEAGMTDYISKPILPDKLFLKIIKLTNRELGQIPDSNLKPQERILVDNGFDKLPTKNETNNMAEFEHINLEFLESQAMGSNDFMLSMINVFLSQTPEAMTEMKVFLEAEDWLQVKATAHKIKPTTIYFGLNTLHEWLQELEDKTKLGEELDTVPELLNRIERASVQAIQELEIEKKKILKEV